MLWLHLDVCSTTESATVGCLITTRRLTTSTDSELNHDQLHRACWYTPSQSKTVISIGADAVLVDGKTRMVEMNFPRAY